MVKPSKIVALALVAVVVMGLVAGVAYWSVGYDPNKVEPGLYVDGSKVENPGTIITVDGHEVDFNVYRYVYMTSKYTISMYYSSGTGEDDVFAHDPDGSLGDYVTEYADESIRQWFAWIDLGEEIGITADDALLAEVEAEIAEDKEMYGAQFESNLAGNYLADEDTYRQVLTIQKLVAKVQEAYSENVEAEEGAALADGIATAKHILITADGFAAREDEYEALMGGTTLLDEEDAEEGEEPAEAEEGTVDGAESPEEEEAADAGEEPAEADEGEAAEEEADAADTADEDAAGEEDVAAFDEAYYEGRAQAFAEWLVEQIRESDDPIATFEELRLEYDEDPGQQTEDYTGYTFAEGQMVTEFYEAALSLDVDEISDPVQTSYGYHILLRLPLDEEAVETNGLVSSAVSSLVNERFNEKYEAQEVVYGEYYSRIRPDVLQ